VDLPFALPTAVSGIALTSIYAPNGWIGQYLEPLGIKAAFSPLGIVIALTFIGLPFVVRTLQPAIEELERENEEAAASLEPIPELIFAVSPVSFKTCLGSNMEGQDEREQEGGCRQLSHA
jgi:ABC-type sulfate transport system permease component